MGEGNTHARTHTHTHTVAIGSWCLCVGDIYALVKIEEERKRRKGRKKKNTKEQDDGLFLFVCFFVCFGVVRKAFSFYFSIYFPLCVCVSLNFVQVCLCVGRECSFCYTFSLTHYLCTSHSHFQSLF